MPDIETRADIEHLLEIFYSKATIDPEIGYFFTEVIPLDMKTHIPVIADFWETVLFGKAVYKGNVLDIHKHIHQLSPFADAHFSRWVSLFTATISDLYEGPRAELARQRAESIATIMKLKTIHAGTGFH